MEDGVDVISVGTSFKRFLEIGKLLKLNIRAVMDNDGNVDVLKQKYEDYLGKKKVDYIKIFFDTDENYKTLEPQMLKANSLTLLNTILGENFDSEGC